MSSLSALPHRVLRRAETFDPRGQGLAVSRSALAIADLMTLLTTPDRSLFTYTSSVPAGVNCDNVRAASLWCIAGTEHSSLLTSRIIATVVLVLVASGYRPRWTCVPHWYVTYSLGVSMTVPNGGEDAARIATMLLIPFCLGDDRVWQWSRSPRVLPATWRGASFAASLVLRLQVCIIYAEAAVSKLLVPEWRNGTAVYSALTNPDFGLPPGLWRHASPALTHFSVTAGLTWGTVAMEALIALLVLGPRSVRRAALAVSCALHLGIVVSLGLFSFGVIMIAMVLAASIDGRADQRTSSLHHGSGEAGRITALIEECQREVDQLTTGRGVVSGLSRCLRVRRGRI